MNHPNNPRVFGGADVLFAGVASPRQHGTSLVVLRMVTITRFEALTSQQVITEADGNLSGKLPRATSAFRQLVERCRRVVPDLRPDDLVSYCGVAYAKDLPILVAAVGESCPWLVTFDPQGYVPVIRT